MTLPSPPTIANARDAAGVMVVTQFQAGHGWVFGGGTTGNLNETTGSPAVGSQYAWIQNSGDNATKVLRRTGGQAYDLTNYDIGVQIRVDNPNQFPATGGSLLLYVGNTAFANYMTYAINVDGAFKTFPKRNTYAQNFGGSWQHWTITTDTNTTLPAYISKSGTQTAAQILANVTDWQLYCKDLNGGPASRVSIQEIYLVPKQSTYPNGVCCMTFDDGYASNYTIAAPIIQAAGGRATIYVIKDSLNTANYLTTQQLKALQNTYGWCAGVHAYAGATHVYPGLTGVTAEAGIDDVQALRQWFFENGLQEFDHIAYPNGAYCVEEAQTSAVNDRPDVTLAPYVQTARTILNRSPETLPPGDRMKLKCYLATSSATSLATLTAAADVCKRQRAVMIVVMHDIVTSNATGAQWLQSDLQSFVTYLGSIGMPIRTIDEVFAPAAFSYGSTNNYDTQVRQMGYHTASGRYADTLAVTMAIGTITTTTTGPTVEMGDRGVLRLTLAITAASGTTPTIDVAVQTSPDGSNWTAVASFSQQTAAATVRKVFAGMDRYARVVETVGGTNPSFTRTISGEAV